MHPHKIIINNNSFHIISLHKSGYPGTKGIQGLIGTPGFPGLAGIPGLKVSDIVYSNNNKF